MIADECNNYDCQRNLDHEDNNKSGQEKQDGALIDDREIISTNIGTARVLSGSVIQEYNSLLSWLRQIFETNLQTKLNKGFVFITCPQCRKPINDVFDMVFVEHYHLICLLKLRYEHYLNDETSAKIQILKINLFQAFKHARTRQTLIGTCPEFGRFLEYLKAEIINQTRALNVQDALDRIQHVGKNENRERSSFLCRFCRETFEYEYLLLRHETCHHPEVITGKHSYRSMRKDLELCPYCRLRFGKGERMQEHQRAHEKALKFYFKVGLKTYQRSTVRSRRREKLKVECDSEVPYATKCYTNKRKRF
ncbi:uncharacterized protein LOC131681522 [Topomyia yanbarensis]|uniref:uncharacterized protein LOC131681521 n=1 Tax=Topomyia yanbarensis TaxID=2498891 RepID=UPI00273BF4C1|nr:uncharacterized protein LOC131681521 [Topomyia yanbarensis]XP_058818321.1 uncharacterized protein LOC131681522 [Topomyia yanbarensis]